MILILSIYAIFVEFLMGFAAKTMEILSWLLPSTSSGMQFYIYQIYRLFLSWNIAKPFQMQISHANYNRFPRVRASHVERIVTLQSFFWKKSGKATPIWFTFSPPTFRCKQKRLDQVINPHFLGWRTHSAPKVLYNQRLQLEHDLVRSEAASRMEIKSYSAWKVDLGKKISGNK